MIFYVMEKVKNKVTLMDEYKPFMVLEDYESAIWTERYWECGDFEITMYATDYAFMNLKTDMLIVNPESDRVMVIEKIEIETDIENGNKIKLSGRSLESILDRRVVWGKKNFMASNSTDTDPKGVPIVDVLTELINENIISPANASRKIDNFIFEKPTDKFITDTLIIAQYIGDSLYDVIVSLCKEMEMGFKIKLNSNNQFVLSFYLGKDRSFDNKEGNAYVIFSPNFENLIKSKYYESSKVYKNVAFVEGAADSNKNPTFAYSYFKINDKEPEGMLRKEVYVDASSTSTQKDDNTQMSMTEYAAVLQEKGNEELVDNDIESAFDGTLDTTGSFQYGKDFFEGDIVQVESEYGHQTKVRVIEMILADDGSNASKTCYPMFKQI